MQGEDDGVEEWRADKGWAGGRAGGEVSTGWECASGECEMRSAASSRPPTGSGGGMSLLNVTMVSRPPTGHSLLYSDRPTGASQLSAPFIMTIFSKALPHERRNVKRFRGGLVFKAHRLLYHSTLGLRVIKKKNKNRIS